MTGVYMVRPVAAEEVRYLVSMGKRLHATSLFKDMDYDEDKTFTMAEAARKMNDRFFFHVIVDVERDVPIGMLLGLVTETYFGKDTVGNDMLLMIEEEHRGKCGTALKELTDRYKHWAFHMGAKRVYLATTTGIEVEKTAQAYEACGFHQIGTIHEA